MCLEMNWPLWSKVAGVPGTHSGNRPSSFTFIVWMVVHTSSAWMLPLAAV